MPMVTILVAVYNASAYLAQCLDSLLGQTLTDLQVICIDDHSTDASLQLLKEYQAKDARIEVMALPENHGQAYARNEGLKQARGEYVCFLDADDWFAADALQQAVEVFQQHPATDCVLFDVAMVSDDHTDLYPLPAFEQLSGEEAFRLSLDWQIHGVYMVRTSLHQQYPYDDTCRLYSDDNTTRIHFLKSRKVRHCSGIYYYRQHAASATHAVSVRRFDFLKANESMKHQLQQLSVDRAILQQWETTRMLVLVDTYMFYHCHGHALQASERAYGLSELHRVWHTIDRTLLLPTKTRKFGYRLMPSWQLFRLQEWLYFTLRGFLGKNK